MDLWHRLPSGGRKRSLKVEIRSPRQQRRVHRLLSDELDRRRATASDADSVEVQPLLRIAGSASYEQFKADQATAWTRQGGRYSARAWPATIDEGEFAALLLPISAGRVGPALGKHPRATMTPHFSHGQPPTSGKYDDIVLGLLATWMRSCPVTVRSAPPVVELVQRGSVTERHLLDFGLTWHLPAPDGI